MKRVSKKKLGRIRKIQKPDTDSTGSDTDVLRRLPDRTAREEGWEKVEKVGNVSTEKVKSLSRTKTPVAKVAINSIPIRLTVDSGVTVTILNYKDWLQIGHTGVKAVSTARKFVGYGADTELPIRARGKVTIQSKRGAVIQTCVYIMEDPEAESLLGRDDAIRLGIITQ